MKKIFLFFLFLMTYFSWSQSHSHTHQHDATNTPNENVITNWDYDPLDYVNPFIGTSNFGATNPGAVAPRGMVSVTPFNVAGEENLPLEKDSRWLSTPYVYENKYVTGFSHVNLSGVGCPDLGVIVAMPTVGKLETNYRKYGTAIVEPIAKPGYFRAFLKTGIRVETTATKRVGVTKYKFPEGQQSNILINLGLGLTNEQGAAVKIVSPTEVEGMRNVGAFCYNNDEGSYPLYFVIKMSKPADKYGVWKTNNHYKGVEAQWMKSYNGKTNLYKEKYPHQIVGDSIGVYFSYNFKQSSIVTMKVGVSYVSIENARENMKIETGNKNFETIYEHTREDWKKMLSKVKVKGGNKDEKTIFYTALYHTLLHPNVFSDANGDYTYQPKDFRGRNRKDIYTTFSLWDTYRNLHPLLCLLYPRQQEDMIRSIMEFTSVKGLLPKWELNGMETNTMVGDPAGIVIADSYLRGLKDIEIGVAYQRMKQGATSFIKEKSLRTGLKDYIDKGYLTTETTDSGSVSITQEYNTSDFAIAQVAKALGEVEDEKKFSARSVSYRKLFDPKYKLLRPKNADGSWFEPFSPEKGANFVKNYGFIEGNAWQYTFMLTHDIKHLMKLMGGKKPFVNQLQKVFDSGQFDMANEPDIAYPFLFNYAKGEEWRTQKTVTNLIKKYFTNKPEGLPGNDDTGTMSAWLIYAMMGFYPVSPADPIYALNAPVFDKITIALDPKFYKQKQLIIEKIGVGEKIKRFKIGGRTHRKYFINHDKLTNGGVFQVFMKQ